MTLYTLIRNLKTDDPEVNKMIFRRVSPKVSYTIIGGGEVEFLYSSKEEASKDAEVWNQKFKEGDLVPAKLTLTGEGKYKIKRFWRETVQEFKKEHSDRELMYMASVVLAGSGAGLALKAGLEQLVNGPSFKSQEELAVAGVLGLISISSYLLGKCFTRATLSDYA